MLIKQNILVTSFDSSLYLLPPFKVVDGVDTIYSNQVALKVSTIPVNVDKPEEFYDIKDVWSSLEGRVIETHVDNDGCVFL